MSAKYHGASDQRGVFSTLSRFQRDKNLFIFSVIAKAIFTKVVYTHH